MLRLWNGSCWFRTTASRSAISSSAFGCTTWCSTTPATDAIVCAYGSSAREKRSQRVERSSRLVGLHREDRRNVGREHEPPSGFAPVDRLLAEGIGHERELLLALVPNRESEHPVEPIECPLAPLVPCME